MRMAATRAAEELIVMLELFCAFRMEAWKHAREIHRHYDTETGMAHVPRLLFGVRLPNKSTTYGMQQIDVSFGTYMKRILGLGGKGIESKPAAPAGARVALADGRARGVPEGEPLAGGGSRRLPRQGYLARGAAGATTPSLRAPLNRWAS